MLSSLSGKMPTGRRVNNYKAYFISGYTKNVSLLKRVFSNI